jgi:hypothetical protein
MGQLMKAKEKTKGRRDVLLIICLQERKRCGSGESASFSGRSSLAVSFVYNTASRVTREPTQNRA